MDPNQPLKKRIVETQSTSTEQREPQRTSRIRNYCHYVPIAEVRAQQTQPEIRPIEEHTQEERQLVDRSTQTVGRRYTPMKLNAWTQTNLEAIPSTRTHLETLKNSVLLSHVKSLQKTLAEKLEFIKTNMGNVKKRPAPQEKANTKPLLPSETKNEVRTYRILSQRNESNNDDSIEIELSIDNEEANDENNPPSPKVYKIRASPKDETHKIRTSPKVETPKSSKTEILPTICEGSPKTPADGEPCILIGPNNTRVPEAEFNKINWGSASIATRKLLTLIFDRETLATHSMTGKASPAFKDLDKPVKGRLDPDCVQDIIHVVSNKCGVSAKEVRSAITTKCADENKMLKLKELKKLSGEQKRPILGELRPRNSAQNVKDEKLRTKKNQ